MVAWEQQPLKEEDQFLGEVLLDLAESNLLGALSVYQLSPHDDNIGPVPRPPRLRKESQGGRQHRISAITGSCQVQEASWKEGTSSLINNFAEKEGGTGMNHKLENY